MTISLRCDTDGILSVFEHQYQVVLQEDTICLPHHRYNKAKGDTRLGVAEVLCPRHAGKPPKLYYYLCSGYSYVLVWHHDTVRVVELLDLLH